MRARIAELLKDIDLPPEFASRYPGQLSGGQKQRVCIARALAAEPDLIICDEVTSALDPLVAEGILDLLGRLQRSHGYAYLFITHDLGTVRRIADRVAVMLKGRLVAEGPREQVFAPPYHPYTKLLLSSVPEMDTHWLDGVLADRAQNSRRCRIGPSEAGIMTPSRKGASMHRGRKALRRTPSERRMSRTPGEKVILVLVDAVGFEAARQSFGTIESLVEFELARRWCMRSVLPSLSAPVYETLHTGTPPHIHGIRSNDRVTLSKGPHVFGLLRQAGRPTGAVAHYFFSELYNKTPYEPLRDMEVDDPALDIRHGRFYSEQGYSKANLNLPSNLDLFTRATFMIRRHHPDYLLIHSFAPDSVGHIYGANSKEYRDEVWSIDNAMAEVIHLWREEGYRILVTADHGQTADGRHGGTTDAERLVPFYDIGNPEGGVAEGIVDQLSVAPTILHSGSPPAAGDAGRASRGGLRGKLERRPIKPFLFVIPAKAGSRGHQSRLLPWIPAFAGDDGRGRGSLARRRPRRARPDLRGRRIGAIVKAPIRSDRKSVRSAGLTSSAQDPGSVSSAGRGR